MREARLDILLMVIAGGAIFLLEVISTAYFFW
jgi:hypothetical protein